jgi:3-dehydroquinate dehydratase type I
MICVSIGHGTPSEAIKMLHKSGFIELRADLLHWTPDQYREVILSGGRTIFTCRPGKYDDSERTGLFEMAILAGARYIDAEIESNGEFLGSLREMITGSNTELIISYHNYKLTPGIDELESILSACYSSGGVVAKIACRACSQADSARLLSLYDLHGRKVVLGMGPDGKITRISAAFLGAEFTFASREEGDATAEGQISYDEMKDIIRILQLNK